ncbi:polysaccharide biosynthesis/export family protein [Castellaniella sp.]|uniref:polysaccharide biosynthesis/export family protein n=1 Tax=Castellaniella sp. TaxID=1955812 RepID=UPI003560D381
MPTSDPTFERAPAPRIAAARLSPAQSVPPCAAQHAVAQHPAQRAEHHPAQRTGQHPAPRAERHFAARQAVRRGAGWLRLAAWLLPVAVLSGCTGMYVGAQGERSTSSGTLDEDILAQVDVHTITPQVVHTQTQEFDAARELARARTDAQLRGTPATPYQYYVAPRDVLNVTVWNHPELNNPAGQLSLELSGRVVDERGYFYYPYIGRVKAAGRTVDAIRGDMANRLAEYLTEPQVDVSVLKYQGRRAYAVGQFKSPGPLPITNIPLHVTDLVTQAGGLTDQADLRLARLTHKSGVIEPLDLEALYRGGDLTQNVLLQDGDVIDVPETRYNKVFVLGEVDKPQSVLLPYGDYSLSEAISDAGGLNPSTSNGSQVYVMRAGDNGRPQVWHLNASNPAALVLADGFRLHARDVVFVDAAGVTRWARVINQMLPSLGGVRTVQGIAQ